MLEKMAEFFEHRLDGYDEHMLTNIESAREEKLSLYTKLWKALKMDGYFILTDYFAASEEEETFFQQELLRLKTAQGITDEDFYHYDTPLTVAHETEILLRAGFTSVEVLEHWGATYSLKAEK